MGYRSGSRPHAHLPRKRPTGTGTIDFESKFPLGSAGAEIMGNNDGDDGDHPLPEDQINR